MARLRPLRDIIAREMRDSSGAMADPLVNELKRSTRLFKKKGQLQSTRKVIHCLFRSVVYLRSKKILHIGAGNGLDSLFLKIAAGSHSKLYLQQQSPSLMKSAARYFSWYKKSYDVIDVNNLNDHGHLETAVKFDLVVFGPAIDPEMVDKAYLNNIAEKSTPSATWLILGANREPLKMKMWELIKEHQFTNASLDCWSFGASFRSSSYRTKINFTYIPWILKPWRIGLFTGSPAASH